MRIDTPISVRYGETDMMGVVYHANYLLYFEDARLDYLRKNGFSYLEIEQAGFVSPVLHIDVTYRSPLRYGEEGFVRTDVVESHATRALYRQRLYRADMDPESDKPLVEGLLTLCLVESGTFRPISLKKHFPRLYEFYGREAEQSGYVER